MGHSCYGRRIRRRTIPSGYPLAVAPIDDTLPAGTLAWLRALAQLDGVPFGYLIGDDRLLPIESIRFVGLDQLWVRHLVDGAYSIGRGARLATAAQSARIFASRTSFDHLSTSFARKSRSA